jgi:RimJ/RimL family protein N-acetyltransferase
VTQTFREYDPERDEPALIDLLTTETWTHRVKVTMTAEEAREELSRNTYHGDAALTLMIELDGEVVGLVRAEDLGNERQDPQLDFRLRERVRGQGIGTAAVREITKAVFDRHPKTDRIEGQTRQDNVAMRKAFSRCGYVKEAVYRQAWPDAAGTKLDGVGYAILRRDWESGTPTPVDWADEP